MRGEVLEFTATGGVIVDGYGARYTFDTAVAQAPLNVGDTVEFAAASGVVTAIIPISNPGPAGAPVFTAPPAASPSGGQYDFGFAMFSFNGRLRRSHYWITWAILFGVGIFGGLIPIVGPLLGIASIWPTLAKDVKRFHDMGRTGWWAAIPAVISIVAFIGAAVMAGLAYNADPTVFESDDPTRIMAVMGPVMGVFGVVFVIQLAFWLWMGVTDSQRGPNRFGPDPKNPTNNAAEVFS